MTLPVNTFEFTGGPFERRIHWSTLGNPVKHGYVLAWSAHEYCRSIQLLLGSLLASFSILLFTDHVEIASETLPKEQPR